MKHNLPLNSFLFASAFVVIFHVRLSASEHVNHLLPGNNNKNQQFDAATWKAPVSFKEALPYSMVGFDNERRRVYYFPWGKWDLRKIAESGEENVKSMFKYYKQAQYKMRYDGKKYAKPDDNFLDEIVLIIDMDQFKLQQLSSAPVMKFFISAMTDFKLIEDIVQYGYFVNVNPVAQTVINVASPSIGHYMERIETFGTLKARWIPTLLRRIPQDQLPPELGGFKNYTSPPQFF